MGVNEVVAAIAVEIGHGHRNHGPAKLPLPGQKVAAVDTPSQSASPWRCAALEVPKPVSQTTRSVPSTFVSPVKSAHWVARQDAGASKFSKTRAEKPHADKPRARNRDACRWSGFHRRPHREAPP